MSTFLRQTDELIDRALQEDIRTGDITSQATVPPDMNGEAVIIAKQDGIIAGLSICQHVFQRTDDKLKFKLFFKDGNRVNSGNQLMHISGNLSAILKAERVALNFLGRLSGVSTLTNKFVQEVKNTHCKILDTRKTTPLFRGLEKYAVKIGGGENHRFGLFDMYLVKENHIITAGSIESILEKVFNHRDKNKIDAKVEVEVRGIEELKIALNYPVDCILLDNMSVETIYKAVRICSGKTKLEVSGGVSLSNVKIYALTGVDYISIGKLTHSVENFDLSLLIN